MAMTMLLLVVGLSGLGAITAGAIALHHAFKGKEQRVAMDKIKTEVIPELEQMTKRMMTETMDLVMDKSVEMTKKMMEAQYGD